MLYDKGQYCAIIEAIIHSDQLGFMPKKSTAHNLRRLFINLQAKADNMGDRALLCLDTHKAFDSVEWQYLWVTMQTFGFGGTFLTWVQLLYSSPQEAIRETGRLSESFSLYRGTIQGCPLSPLLFAIAIDPLAAMIQSNTSICGFKYGNLPT